MSETGARFGEWLGIRGFLHTAFFLFLLSMVSYAHLFLLFLLRVIALD